MKSEALTWTLINSAIRNLQCYGTMEPQDHSNFKYTLLPTSIKHYFGNSGNTIKREALNLEALIYLKK